MIRAAALVAALLLPVPLAAQTADGAQPGERAAVLAAFTRLVDNKARPFFGVPPDTFWRHEDALELALYADEAEALRPLLASAAEPFAAVSGLAIPVVEAAPPDIAGRRKSELAPEAELVIVIAPRLALARFAADNGFNRGMLASFELGSWPFVFHFDDDDDDRRRGIVLLADDEPARAREAFFILATVWGLGAVTLGPELTGLVTDSAAGPRLTPRGAAVFRLFYHPGLTVGMPIADAVQRAATLLPR